MSYYIPPQGGAIYPSPPQGIGPRRIVVPKAVPKPPPPPAGWLEGWSYRKSHVIEGSTAGPVTDYQIRIVVHYGSGTDSGEHVYLNGKCRTDFGDIRFTADDGSTLLDYWMEEYVDSDYAIFWVKVPSIPASPDTVTIYIYYGKSDATTTSDITKTFIFGHDFRVQQNTDGWILSGDPDSVTFSGTEGIKITKTSGVAHLRSEASFDFSTLKRVLAQFRVDNTLSYSVGVQLCPTVTTDDPYYEDNWIRMCHWSTVYLRKKLSGSISTLSSLDLDPTVFVKHELRVKIASTGYIVWVVNDETQYVNESEELYEAPDNYLYLYVDAASGNTKSLILKYVAIAKYVDPEPAHGAWGSEETA